MHTGANNSAKRWRLRRQLFKLLGLELIVREDTDEIETLSQNKAARAPHYLHQ
jgi:hypothetical protein